MNHRALTPIQLQDCVKLRKPHACGGYEWTIVRLGADIGLTCNQCGRRVLLPRMEFERRLVEHMPGKMAGNERDKPATDS